MEARHSEPPCVIPMLKLSCHGAARSRRWMAAGGGRRRRAGAQPAATREASGLAADGSREEHAQLPRCGVPRRPTGSRWSARRPRWYRCLPGHLVGGQPQGRGVRGGCAVPVRATSATAPGAEERSHVREALLRLPSPFLPLL